MRINIRNVFDEEPKKLKEIIEGKTNISQEPEAEPTLEPEPEEEPEAEPTLEPELEEEPEDPEETEPESEVPEPRNFMRLYGSLFAIAAVLVLLMVSLFAYTNLVPRQVSMNVDGKIYKITTKEYTVANMLAEQEIKYYEEDYLSTPPTGFIHDGMKFKLTHATNFKVTADGKTTNHRSLEGTVGEALKDVGVKFGKNDIITPAADVSLTDNMKVTVQRVEIKKVTVREKVEFKTVNKDDTSMNEGETKVETEGVNGRDKVTYEITYIDGKESSRKELSRETIKPAVDKVVLNGTRINYNGKNYSRKLVVKAYSYTGGGTTAMGTRARVGEIAVDPNVIPLGTNVYIEGIGARRAEDTGGNIKGNTIDIYMATHAECIRWGVRYVTIYIE